MAGEEGGKSGARSAVRLRLLEAAESCLLREGYAALSTRAVAEQAQTQLSQIHYHFGSKQGLVLALLDYQNQKLLRRQATTLSRDAPLASRWQQACDHLEEDLASGYVRVLQEIIALGYSDAEVASAARDVLNGWFVLLTQMSGEIRTLLGALGTLRDEELGCLIGLLFLGAESMILIEMNLPVVSALRGVGSLLERLEQVQRRR